MLKRYLLSGCLFFLITVLCFAPEATAGPKGAKAIFDSGEGPAVGMSVTRAPSAAPVVKEAKEKYVGISYQLMLLSDDGQLKVVPKTRTFRSGERLKMLVRTNRPGYMTILNIGSSGNTNILFNEYVEAFTMLEIPKNTNFRFVGEPGTEKLLIMLSNEPNPIGGQSTMTADSAPPPAADSAIPPPSSAGDPNLPPPSSGNVADLPPPPPMMLANIEGAKSVKGAKDIVAEDGMQSSYAVVSPKNKWKPVRAGVKDIVLESNNGVNYSAVPVSAVADGGILSLEIKLKHR